MAITSVGVNSPQAVKRFALGLNKDMENEAYFNRQGLISEGDGSVIERKVELEDDAGDEIRFDLLARIKGTMTYGDEIVEGKTADLKYYQDAVRIDQVRTGVSAGGRMTRKRTLHNIRTDARRKLAVFFAEWQDDMIFAYLSGDSALAAVNEDNKFTVAFAGNSIQAPDTDHLMYAGAATSKATVAATDKVSVALMERIAVKLRMMNAKNVDVMNVQPVKVEGMNTYIALISEFGAYDLRTETGDLGWVRYQNALTTSVGRASPLFRGGEGMINNIVIHKHQRVRRFSDYGAGSNVAAARNLVLGAQAGVMAYGTAGAGTRMMWVEKLLDADNLVDIYVGAIMGFKKSRFNNKDFGVVAVDSAAKDPN